MAEAQVVIDASALLALLADEPGAEAVEEALPTAAMSAVNLSEVIGKLAEAGLPEEGIRSAIDGLGLDVRPFAPEDAWACGLLRPSTRGAGLSLGDRACLGLALRLGVLTLGIQVRLVR